MLYNGIFITILFNPLCLRGFGPEEVLTIVFFSYLKKYLPKSYYTVLQCYVSSMNVYVCVFM